MYCVLVAVIKKKILMKYLMTVSRLLYPNQIAMMMMKKSQHQVTFKCGIPASARMHASVPTEAVPLMSRNRISTSAPRGERSLI